MPAAEEIDPVKWEAAQWIERRMDGGPFDENAFADWATRDPRHQSAFDAMWRRIMGPETASALHDYRRRSASRRTALKSATAALLFVAAGYNAVPWIELKMARPQEIVAAGDEVREIKLDDGTRITLGGGAAVRIVYTNHERVLEMTEGVLFAQVAHDENRSFRIRTADAEIVDVGTSFEVVSKPSNVRVTVAEGVVQFASAAWFSKPIHLNANEAARLDRDGLKRIANVRTGEVAAWRSEWVEYQGKPLRDVIADLQSLSPLPIQIASEQLATLPVSGRIRLTDPIGQLENLSVIHSFQIRKGDGTLIISQAQ